MGVTGLSKPPTSPPSRPPPPPLLEFIAAEPPPADSPLPLASVVFGAEALGVLPVPKFRARA